MSKRVVLTANVQNLGARGLITPALPDHYANVLIRRGLAKLYEVKTRKNKLEPQVKAVIAPEKPDKEYIFGLRKIELKNKLDNLNIEYPSNAKKAFLRELLLNAG